MLFDTVYYKKRVDHTDLVTCAEQCIGEDEIMPDTDLLHLLMSEHHWAMPDDATSAAKLYMNLMNVPLPLIGHISTLHLNTESLGHHCYFDKQTGERQRQR